MDTKWKRNKAVISYLFFFLGITLLLHSVLFFLERISLGLNVKEELQYILEKDYQNTREFKNFIDMRLHDFLAIASHGSLPQNTEYKEYYNSPIEGTLSFAASEETCIQSSTNDSVPFTISEEFPSEEWYNNEYFYYYDLAGNVQAAKRFHETIKNDKNLLYTITFNNAVVCTNASDFHLSGPEKTLPEGYNYFLYFDGNKVTIIKDGKELDIYGDGYYEEGDWYIPGYENVTIDDNARKTTICMAVKKLPALYQNFSYSSSSDYNYDGNSPYYIVQNQMRMKKLYFSYGIVGLLGILFFTLHFIFRRSKEKGDSWFAHLCHKIWLEVKVFILITLVGYILYRVFYSSELYWILKSGLSAEYHSFSFIGRDIFISILSYKNSIVLLFWLLYFLWNEHRYYKPIWQKSAVYAVYHSFQNAFQKSVKIFPFVEKIKRQYQAVFWIETSFLTAVFILFGIYCAKTIYYTSILFLYSGLGILFMLLGFIILIRYIFTRHHMMVLQDMNSLLYQISAIRNGNLTDALSIPESEELSEAVQDLNDIQHGMEIALKEQMQSEQLKVELVSNVSHDIKTPLTSIISYVDLLKQENLPENLKDYVQVLDNKAQRLKAMVQDVFDISKAASGQLTMHLEQLDFGKLLEQTLADMEETISASSLSIKKDLPAVPTYILADGQRLYRVFQNLIQNALQYSLEGSRIYISLKSEGNLAVASIKNTSKTEIKETIHYAERFVRGDDSRSDGGSGLGLSIAQTFTQACNGKFYVETIADLFVVTIEFPKVLNTSQVIEA